MHGIGVETMYNTIRPRSTVAAPIQAPQRRLCAPWICARRLLLLASLVLLPLAEANLHSHSVGSRTLRQQQPVPAQGWQGGLAGAILSRLFGRAQAPAARSAPAASRGSAAPADVMYIGGPIVTLDPARPTVDALAVGGGRIAAVGSRADVEKLKGPATQVVDLKGKALLPGFIDGHSHYIESLTLANRANVYPPPNGPGSDPQAIVKAVKDFFSTRKVSKGETLIAYGYDDSIMPEGKLLDRGILDTAFTDNPVVVIHVSGHGAVLNSAALQKFGINASTPTPPGGVIVRKPGTNEPYGLIMELAFLPISKALEAKPKDLQQAIDWSLAGQRIYACSGITTAQEGATSHEDLRTIQEVAKSGKNLIDIVALPLFTDIDAILKENPKSEWGRYKNRVKLHAVKAVIDGSPQGRTAAFTTPYLTGGPAGEKNWKGDLLFPQEVITKGTTRFYKEGIPVFVHANGDAAIDAFLTAHEAASGGDPGRPRGTVIVHAQFTRKDQIPKYKAYNITPTFYPLHTFYFAAAHKRNRGEAQTAYLSPMRDAIDAGIRPTHHTDFTIAPLDQMFMMWAAVNRIGRDGKPVGPGQRITPLEALKGMTIWSAEVYREGGEKGTLQTGKLADLVILSENPLTVDPMQIKNIKVVETIKEGQTICKQ